MDLTINPAQLKPRPTTAESVKLWEKKNFNIHRGIIEWHVPDTTPSIKDISRHIRQRVNTDFKIGWWRGFAFGTILHLRSSPPDIADASSKIDRYNNGDGTWQWNIICFDDEKVALCIHTWLHHGYLRPVYESLVEQLKTDGFTCAELDIEKGKLIETLEKIHSLSPSALLARLILADTKPKP